MIAAIHPVGPGWVRGEQVFVLWFGGVVALLSIFWVIDLPQTVRLKAAIVRMLPLDPDLWIPLSGAFVQACTQVPRG